MRQLTYLEFKLKDKNLSINMSYRSLEFYLVINIFLTGEFNSRQEMILSSTPGA